MLVFSFLSLLAGFSGGAIVTQSASSESSSFDWSYQSRKAWSESRRDADSWDIEIFNEDLENALSNEWPTRPAISHIASPAPRPNHPLGGINGKFQLNVGERSLTAQLIGWSNGSFANPESRSDTFDTSLSFVILLRTDQLEPELRKADIVSRNYPYLLSTGTQRYNGGDVDWVQIHHPDGRNLAIVNQRVFDLEFGNVLVVIPQIDGSIRFYQTSGPEGISNRDIQSGFSDLKAQLRSDEELVDLVKSPSAI